MAEAFAVGVLVGLAYALGHSDGRLKGWREAAARVQERAYATRPPEDTER